MLPEFNVAFERRSKLRFPVRLSVRYHTLTGGPSLIGVGRTLNVSSCGLLIALEEPANLRMGARLQMVLDWPFLLHGTTPLQLIVSCRVTRSRPQEFAVRLDQYQFKTKKR